GIGIGSGKSRAREAAMTAISSPLLETSVEGASGVVFNITGGEDMTLHEVNAAAETIYEVVDPNANIIFGAVIDPKLDGEIRITVIATGFAPKTHPAIPPQISKRSPQSLTSSSKSTLAPPTSTSQSTSQSEIKISKPGLDIPDFLQRRRPPK
ncbi:MAG: cell division protein FtsZ, partial [Pseudanabaena sp.]